MKKIFFLLFFIVISNSCGAESFEEQKIETENKKCAIHYLTAKHKNLWTIDVNENYCKDGWVNGFASVVLKDSLRRSVKTLEGYFEKGYWLSDFPGEVGAFYRMEREPQKQDLVFEMAKDDELDVVFYRVARSEGKNEEYGAFEICPLEPSIIVTHQPVSDFKTSLFQSKLIRLARDHLLSKCPKIKKFDVWGVESVDSLSKWIFQARFDLASEEMTLNYQTMLDPNDIPRPSELRHEQGENLITIHPQKNEQKKEDVGGVEAKNKDDQSRNEIKSAVDLSLLAQVLQQEIKGKTIVYVTTKRSDYSFVVTHPLPLVLKFQEMLSTGWYLIDAVFQPQEEGALVQVLSAKKCQKEWCVDEK